MAIDLGRKDGNYYDGDKIANAFKEYNLILFTSVGTIDTSLYNACKYTANNTGMDTGNINNSNNGGFLEFANNPKATTTVPQIGENELKPHNGTRIIRIDEREIQNVIVKSKRNFLLNQTIAIKR